MTILVLVATFFAIVVTWSRPRVMVVLALTTVLFVRTAQHLSGIQSIDNVDDFLTVGVIVRAVQARFFDPAPVGGRRKFPGMIWFVAFAVLGMLGGVIQTETQQSTIAAGTFLAMKGVALGWATAQFCWPDFAIRKFVSKAAPVVVLVSVLAIVSFAVPTAWAKVFSVNGGTIDRYGRPSALGPFIHPFDLAYFSAMAAVAGITWLTIWGASKWIVPAVVGGALGTFLSFRRKDLLGLVVALAIIAMVRKRWLLLSFFVIFLPVVIILAFDEIAAEFHSLIDAYFAPDSREARTVLMAGAVRLASEYFPLGAGFGRFASRTAAVDYSPEYFRLGMNTVYGLGPGPNQGAFLTDTSWPAVIGEAGWIGAACFVIGLICIGRAFRGAAQQQRPVSLFLGVTGLAWLILTVFQSTGSAVFTAPPLYAAFFVLAGIVGSRRSSGDEVLGSLDDFRLVERPVRRSGARRASNES
ncbi:hypothetical protein [Microbacterium sp. BH-3-3-3]|uniref:hypothetical protein n=1 Tax=Microbacterium sp. BH-3-3-3 TaxID=1906742 RepID=UPI00119FA1F7|nr:hypothetical protein [Microbacterium sp. BH-3-3-3]